MQTILRTDVPEYLRRGLWYEALDPDDDVAFDVPAKCFKPDPIVRSKADLFFLLRSLQFWQVTRLPSDALGFIYLYDLFDAAKEYPLFSSSFQHLRTMKEATGKNRVFTTSNQKSTAAMICQQHQHTKCVLFVEACALAAGADDLVSLAYLHENGCPWDSNTIREAIRSGKIECLAYAQVYGCPSLPTYESLINLAAQWGHVDVLKYLWNRGEEWDDLTMSCAASSGNLACMQYLHNAGCPWGEHACLFAVMKGSLECLQFAHHYGSPWSSYITPIATCNGDLRCLQYAHNQGCEWNALVMCFAARNDRPDIMQFAHEHGCPWHKDTLYSGLHGVSHRCHIYALFHGADCVTFGLDITFNSVLVWIVISLVIALCRVCAGDASKLGEVVLYTSMLSLIAGMHAEDAVKRKTYELLLPYLSPTNCVRLIQSRHVLLACGFFGIVFAFVCMSPQDRGVELGV